MCMLPKVSLFSCFLGVCFLFLIVLILSFHTILIQIITGHFQNFHHDKSVTRLIFLKWGQYKRDNRILSAEWEIHDSSQAPVLLTIFRCNSKFDHNLQCFGLKCAQPITTKFCTRQDSVTFVTCTKFRCSSWAYFKLEHAKFWSNF